MNDLDQPAPLSSPGLLLLPSPEKTGRGGWRRTVLLASTLCIGVMFGAGGFAYAAIATGGVDWHHGMRIARVQSWVQRALDSVGATTAQEGKIHDIIAAGFANMGDSRGDMREMRRQILDLLQAPTIDRAAVEKLRSEQVARFDAKSKAMLGIILDSADQLTPDQRKKLGERAEAMMQHRGPGGWGRLGGPGGWGGMGGPGREPADHPHPDGPGDEDHGPDGPAHDGNGSL